MLFGIHGIEVFLGPCLIENEVVKSRPTRSQHSQQFKRFQRPGEKVTISDRSFLYKRHCPSIWFSSETSSHIMAQYLSNDEAAG